MPPFWMKQILAFLGDVNSRVYIFQPTLNPCYQCYCWRKLAKSASSKFFNHSFAQGTEYAKYLLRRVDR